MSYNPLPEDINGNVLTRISQHDIFDQIVTTNRANQISSSFFSTANVSDLVSVANTGTATTTMANGKALFQSGTGTTAVNSATTYTNVQYTPGTEVYAMFTSTYTVPTAATSTQFIGLWDIVNNGFYVGYNGTTFGTAVMTGGVQTFTARTAWNGDLLNGAPTSKFTRNGVPEAINLTFINLFRIRFGWLGAAPVVYEVCSPDGDWIVFHTILKPNTSANPSIENPNLPISLRITKTASDSTNLAITCACWAAGTSSPSTISVSNFNQVRWTSGSALNSSIFADTTTAGNAAISIIVSGTVSAGVVFFEVSPDGTNWFPLSVRDPVNGNNITSYNLVNGNATWQVYVGGYVKTRCRLSTLITGAGNALVEIRPSLTAAPTNIQVYQPTGANLHVQIDATTATGLAPASVNIGLTSTAVLAANQLRKGAIFTNRSNNIISFGLSGNAAVLNAGITLSPNGVWVMDAFTFTTGAITAISNVTASALAVQEMQ